jgi:ABC-type polysaccharide transport system permease subunit
LGAEAYFFTVQTNKGEDIAGGVAMAIFMMFISTITIIMANLIEKKVQNGMNVKSESNLTP